MSKRTVPRRLRPIGCLVAIVVAGTSLRAAGDAGPPVRVSPPEGFPAATATVFEAEVVGDVESPPPVVRFKLPGGKPALAQWDTEGERYLCLGSLDPARIGKPVTLRTRLETRKPAVTIRRTDGGFRFFDGDRRVMDYRQDPNSLDGKSKRANYVHPLYGSDGSVLTQDFPADHIHHRGVFWAWHQVYVGDRRAGDSWVNQDLLSVVKEARALDEGPLFATLKVRVHWESARISDAKGSPTPIVQETTQIRLFRRAAPGQFVDFEVRLEPLLPEVRIGGAENERGYSGFTVRVRPPREIRIAAEGTVLKEDAVGIASRWADVSGRFGQDDRTTGIAILSHRSLPQFPPKWLLRHYGMQNVVYPGRHPVPLSAERPLVLRHRLLLHRGDATEAGVAAQQRAYELLGTGR